MKPFRSRPSYTSTYLNTTPSKTLTMPSSPILAPEPHRIPLRRRLRISHAKSNVVLPPSSATSGSAPRSSSNFAKSGLTYLIAMCNTERTPLRWSAFALHFASGFTHHSEPGPATKRSAVRPSMSTTSTSRPLSDSTRFLSTDSSAFFATVHHGSHTQ
ncbi:hypothetical protein ACSQ67_026224 [Phaseolus vulgaris]